jgi:DNA helicase-2/ATP-dependent DNA helicase PcrA
LDGADPKSQVPEPALSLPKGPKSQVSGVKSRTATTFQKGDSVSHPAFGEGIVIESQIVGGDEQVSVLFKGQPTPKKLSLSFAPLQRA